MRRAGGLFERLEEGVLRLEGHPVDILDDDDLAVPLDRFETEHPGGLAHRLDLERPLVRQHVEIRMGTGGDLAASGALAAGGRRRGGGLAQQPGPEVSGRRGFADPRGPLEEEGVRDPTAGHPSLQTPARVLLSVQRHPVLPPRHASRS